MNPGNWNILFHWRIIVTQFCVFACYSRLQNIQQNIEGTTIHSQLPTKKLHGNCSVIVVLPQSTGGVDVPSVSVFYGVQLSKELLDVLEIDALILSSSYASFRLPSERNLKARNTPQVETFERVPLSRQNVWWFGAHSWLKYDIGVILSC